MKKFISVVALAAFVSSLNMSLLVYAANNTGNSSTLEAKVQENQESAASFMSRASEKFMKKDVKGAIDDMNQAITIAPNSPLLYLNRGYLKQVINDQKGAMDDYNTAIKINPNYIYAYNNRGVLKASMNDVQGAMDDYAAALAINSGYADIYYNRANLKYMLSDNKGALADYDKAIELNPKDADAFNNRGVVKKRMNYNVGALSDYTQAIALNPKDSIAYSNRGKLKKLYFDNEGAAIDLNQAIALAETQTFIKNVKPLVSNERYIAAIPYVEGITPDNPAMIKIPPKENEKLVEKLEPKSYNKVAKVASTTPKKDGTKLALASTAGNLPGIKSTTAKSSSVPSKAASVALTKSSTNTPVINAGIGKVKAIEPPDIRTMSVTKNPTTNVRLAESYYIRGLQKCVLRDLQGAIADLDKAIANNSKYADAYFYRGAIRKELGDTEGFRKDYATAIEINPSLQAFNDSNALALIQ